MKPLHAAVLFLAAVATTPALAQEPENTRAACSDRRDNDGDGHVDCDDQDCQDLVLCASAVPRASGRATDDTAHLRGRGVTQVVVGAVLLSFGVVVGGASAALWVEGGAESGPNGFQFGGIAMDVLGVGLIATGTALLALGSGKLAESRRPRLALGPSSFAVRF